MAYNIIAGDFVGNDDGFDDGYDDVDAILAGYDIVGAQYAPPPYGRQALARPAPRGFAPRRPAPQAAAASAAALNRQYLNMALQQKRANAGLIVNQQQPTASRRLVLGMSSTGTVASGALATITARPQNLAFKPERIVIPATIASDFLITDIKVGNVSQLVQSGTLPAEAFTQQLFDGKMEMDTVNTSQDFVLQIQNTAGAARSFNAAVYGLAVLAR